jgi:2-polyprenyl-3-methyl-5-hydroxy-6-metoxy-1,4-benzoquinol methylase
MGSVTSQRYLEGDYLAQNPGWHEVDAPWKAAQIFALLGKAALQPRSICEVGCGSGHVLELIVASLPGATGDGYDISPQARALSAGRARPGLRFHNQSPTGRELRFDLAMAIDVIEHVEDPFRFARDLASIGDYQLFHIPLDMNAVAVARGWPVMNARSQIGHLHYFTRDTALALLRDSGLAVIAEQYTPWAIDQSYKTWKKRLAAWPRRIAFRINAHASARVLGGWSLLVLTRKAEPGPP